MSSFTGDIVVKKIGENLWEVYTPFEYYVGEKDDKNIITVPLGLVTDFASVPRLFWAILPPDGKYTAAAVLHDFLYFDQTRKRSKADSIFLEAMGVLGVPLWKRSIMYAAVRAFGWIPWNNKKNARKRMP